MKNRLKGRTEASRRQMATVLLAAAPQARRLRVEAELVELEIMFGFLGHAAGANVFLRNSQPFLKAFLAGLKIDLFPPRSKVFAATESL